MFSRKLFSNDKYQQIVETLESCKKVYQYLYNRRKDLWVIKMINGYNFVGKFSDDGYPVSGFIEKMEDGNNNVVFFTNSEKTDNLAKMIEDIYKQNTN